MSHPDRITVNPNQCRGGPCLRGQLIRLAAVVSHEEIPKDCPYLEENDILATLEFAAVQADHPVLRVVSRSLMKFLIDAQLPPGLSQSLVS